VGDTLAQPLARKPFVTELQSNFVFTLCQRGAEPALKRELARIEPAWNAAYQRPGLVTFKTPQPVSPDLKLHSVFARSHGISLGNVRDFEELAAKLQALPTPLCLQVVEPDQFRPDEEPSGFEPGAHARELDAQVRRALPRAFTTALPRLGDLVLTVIAAPQDPWLLGLHRHTAERCPYPGGRHPVVVPPEAPSRAYAKIEEAIGLFQLPVRTGDVALEIGAAPGGAAYALLRRGVPVIGVDPGAMDQSVLDFVGPARARLLHYAIPVAELRREQLPAHVDWLLLDVHLAPQVALRAARRMASWFRGDLLGAVLTLKLNDWAFADDVDSFLQQAREMGLVQPTAKQLASHRQELAIVGLTARGQLRRS
jgi:23S rRNA (cytidine2498-2'-O)-methyltransferase